MPVPIIGAAIRNVAPSVRWFINGSFDGLVQQHSLYRYNL